MLSKWSGNYSISSTSVEVSNGNNIIYNLFIHEPNSIVGQGNYSYENHCKLPKKKSQNFPFHFNKALKLSEFSKGM